MIIVNPEFHRYLWLKFSPFKLLAMPLIVGMVLVTFSNFNLQDVPWQSTIFLPAFYIYLLVVFLWGSYEAASASNSDVGMNTWDFQKMSSIGPWELLTGKLLGATAYSWYFGFAALGIMAFSFDYFVTDLPPLASDALFSHRTRFIIYMICAGVMGQASSFLFGMQSIKKNKLDVALPFILGCVVSINVLWLTIGSDVQKYVSKQQASVVDWHGLSVETNLFVLLSLAYSFFWIIMAIQRYMRDELQFKNSPAVWMLFVATICFYLSGFVNGASITKEAWKILAVKFSMCYFLVIFATYFLLFMEAPMLSKYKRWALAIKSRDWKRAFENTSAWVATLVFLIPFYILSNLWFLNFQDIHSILPTWVGYFTLTTALLLITARDGMVFHIILIGKIQKHKGFLLLFYFLMAYVLLPFMGTSILTGIIKGGLHSKETVEEILLTYLRIFFPMPSESVWGIAPLLLQSLIVWLMLVRTFGFFKKPVVKLDGGPSRT